MALELMSDAAKEIVDQGAADSDGVVNTNDSCDCSWQRRGFFSFNQTFTCMSMDSGKVLDVNVRTRCCKGCVNADNLMKINPDLAHKICETSVLFEEF